MKELFRPKAPLEKVARKSTRSLVVRMSRPNRISQGRISGKSWVHENTTESNLNLYCSEYLLDHEIAKISKNSIREYPVLRNPIIDICMQLTD